MTISLSNSLAGLTMLTGVNGFSSFGAMEAPETNAVRKAKAAFTTLATTPPWKEKPAAGVNDSTQLAAIKRMASIIDKVNSGAKALPNDVQMSFTTYKALDRLRIMAETAGKSTTSSAERAKLNQLFAKGMADIQTYLGQAPTDKLDLSFGNPTRRADSVGVAAAPSSTIAGKPLVAKRTDALPGLTGTEQFTITLKTPSGGASEQFSVDLSLGTQPPTLDSIADQINAAISATPLLDANGVVQLDANGVPLPRWQAKMVPTKTGDKWGLQFDNPQMSQIAIDQTNGKDALMVATGQRAADATISTVQMLRLDDPAAGGTKVTLGEIAAYDRLGTESAKLEAAAKTATVPKGVTLSTPYVEGNTTAAAMVTGPDGATYVVGTAAGELGGNRPAGSQDLYLTKTDSEGKVLWQRMLGASESANGAAISFAANGDVLVAGTVTGGFGSDSSDGDMLVARFDVSGEEKFATLVRSLGADSATAITSGADGSIYVGGQSGEVSGDAVIAKLDSTGKLTDRRTIGGTGTQTITALAMGSDGNLVALTKEGGEAVLRKIDNTALASDLSSLSLGSADARALAVGSDGTIAVGGATLTALNGTQVNGLSANREGFVARIDSALGSASISYVGTDGTDEIDSVAFMNGRIYAGGRTTGVIDGTSKTGITDGFVASFDPANGSQLSIKQFGQMSERTEAVRISAAAGGSTALGALGFARGSLTTQDSETLVAQTSRRHCQEDHDRSQRHDANPGRQGPQGPGCEGQRLHTAGRWQEGAAYRSQDRFRYRDHCRT